RPGLLYRISRILVNHGIHLHGARINTLGERAEDTFLISGQDVESPSGQELLRRELMEELEE
ncbi:MAG: hypothetical protein KGI81_06455, partial [Betaproteobacteria bacterium]|nr:hypothetical protein [Betaproteobacteria bacterium]